MAKYYLQSGQINFVVQAADAEAAALWMLNQVVSADGSSREGTLAEDFQLSRNELMMCKAVFALDQLDNEIMVSQIGFGRSEAGLFDTELIFKHWVELLDAMSKLFDQL